MRNHHLEREHGQELGAAIENGDLRGYELDMWWDMSPTLISN